MVGNTCGQALQVVSGNDDRTFNLNLEALGTILMHDEVKDRPVVVVSVAGSYRKGKSFLLSFFVRYLQSKGANKWLGTGDCPLEGFHWRGGSNADTKGILMWSEPFLVDLPSGEKVAVLLMDTQGAFDTETTINENAIIFALSTMISSLQIFNIMHNIQEDDLQHLQLFTDYGRMAIDETGETPFQKLQFLVRDWMSPDEYPFGSEGGSKLLNNRLRVSKGQQPELKSLRQHIRSCFAEISCCLMPYPGLKVAEDNDFDGKIVDIRTDFMKELSKFVPELLAPENLVVKEIGGQKVKGKDLLNYFVTYMELFEEGNIPEVKTIIEATADANNRSAVANAREIYRVKMLGMFGDGKKVLEESKLQEMHAVVKKEAMNQFNKEPKFGGDEYSEPFVTLLEQDLDDLYRDCVFQNKKFSEKLTANNQIAVGTAKEFYRSAMNELFGELKPLLNENELLSQHKEIKGEALEQFKQQPDTGDEEFSQPFYYQLEEDLGELYHDFVVRNNAVRAKFEARTLAAVESAKDLYRFNMQQSFSESKLFLEDDQLLFEHEKIHRLALEHFQEQSNIVDEEFKKPFHELLKEGLEELYQSFVVENSSLKIIAEGNNQLAVVRAKDFYRSEIQGLFGEDKPLLKEEELRAKHIKIKGKAVDEFMGQPNIGSEEFSKPFLALLEENVEKIYQEFVVKNNTTWSTTVTNNQNAISSSKEAYRSGMNGLFESSKSFANEGDLRTEHEKMKSEATRHFNQQPNIGGEEISTPYLLQLSSDIEDLYQDFVTRNNIAIGAAKDKGQTAVLNSKEFYRSRMQQICGANNPLIEQDELSIEHSKAKLETFDYFKHQPNIEFGEIMEQFLAQLDNDLENLLQELLSQNIALLKSTEDNHQAAVASARDSYHLGMQNLLEETKSGLKEADLLEVHQRLKMKAVDSFPRQLTYSGKKYWEPFISQLDKEIEGMFLEFVVRNKRSKDTAEANNLIALVGAQKFYRTQMKALFFGPKFFIEENVLPLEHQRIKRDAVAHLKSQPSAGYEEIAAPLMMQLDNDLEEMYQEFAEQNSTIMRSTAETESLNALANAKELYRSRMQTFYEASLPLVERPALELHHVKTRMEAVDNFTENEPKFCRQESSANYLTQLEREIDQIYQGLKLNCMKMERHVQELNEKAAAEVEAIEEIDSPGPLELLLGRPVIAVAKALDTLKTALDFRPRKWRKSAKSAFNKE